MKIEILIEETKTGATQTALRMTGEPSSQGEYLYTLAVAKEIARMLEKLALAAGGRSMSGDGIVDAVNKAFEGESK